MNQDQIIIALGEALCRCRALSDAESRWLERAVRREDARTTPKRKGWTPADDAALLKAHGKVEPAIIAQNFGRSVAAIHIRAGELRKAQRATTCINKRERREVRV